MAKAQHNILTFLRKSECCAVLRISYNKNIARVKNSKQLKRHLKGVANHRRIDILFLVNRFSGITLDKIAGESRYNLKTIAEHTRRLCGAWFSNKKYKGRTAAHSLSPCGQKILEFIRTFSLQ